MGASVAGLVEKFENLGFTSDDALVYITLVKQGRVQAAEILDQLPQIGKTDRWRVYEALKRLVKKKYVRKYPTTKDRARPEYAVVHPDEVFVPLKDRLQTQLEDVEDLQEALRTQYQKVGLNQYADTLVGNEAIRQTLARFLLRTRHTVKCILPPPNDVYGSFLATLADRLEEGADLAVHLFLDARRHMGYPPEVVAALERAGATTSQVPSSSMPFGLFVLDNHVVMVFYHNPASRVHEPLLLADVLGPTFDVGFAVEDADERWVEGFEHLFDWFQSTSLALLQSR